MPYVEPTADPLLDSRLPPPPRFQRASAASLKAVRHYVCQAIALGYTLQQTARAVGCSAKTLQTKFSREIAAIRNRHLVDLMVHFGATLSRPGGEHEVAGLEWLLTELGKRSPAFVPIEFTADPEDEEIQEDDDGDDGITPEQFERFGKWPKKRWKR